MSRGLHRPIERLSLCYFHTKLLDARPHSTASECTWMQMATAVVEPYNCVFCTDTTLDQVDCVFLADNEALYGICHSRLDINNPNYTSLNRLLAQTVSSITASLRYPGSLNADFTDFQTNLVPYPRVHFPVISYAPIVAKKVASKEGFSVLDISNRYVINT